MTSNFERTDIQLINSGSNNRVGSLLLASKSNEHSPKHHPTLLTPTNHEQSKNKTNVSCFSFKYLFLYYSDSLSFLSIFINIK